MIQAPVQSEADRTQEIPDQELLQRFVSSRDEAAFRVLVERHSRTVWNVARRVLPQDQDVEDVFQAVFLILARKAAAIRKGEAVGSWLYGVTYRTAMKASRGNRRRKGHEKLASSTRSSEPPWSAEACRELQRLFDEEVQRLPHKYQAPFVLCCLQGLSKGEAARELGWKEGTVSGRLAQARKELQRRLTRRGVELTAILGVAALSQASSAAPGQLVLATVQGIFAAAGSGPALSPSAVVLAGRVIRTMATRGKLAALLGLALIVVVAVTGLMALQFAHPRSAAAVEPESFQWPPVPFWTPDDNQTVSLAFSPDGKRLAIARAQEGHPGQVEVCDPVTGKGLLNIPHARGVRAVALSPDGKTLAIGDSKGELWLREPATGQQRAVVPAHAQGVTGLAFSPDSRLLASVGLDDVVKLWDVAAIGTRAPREFRGHTGIVHGVAFFHDGKRLVTAGQDKTAMIWDLREGKAVKKLVGHDSAVQAVAVSTNDVVVATGGWDQHIRLWDAATGLQSGAFPGNEGAILRVTFSPLDANLLASAAMDGSVRLWDLKEQKGVRYIGRHATAAWAVAFSPRGDLLASGSADTTKLWDVASAAARATLDNVAPSSRPLLALAYDPTGKVVALSGEDNQIHLRDSASGEEVAVLSGHTGPVICLAFSPDGQLLASGSADRSVRLWQWAARREKLTLPGQAGVEALAFAPDGRKLASAGGDGTLAWWEVETGKQLSASPGHDGGIAALAMARDGSTLASAGSDGTIKIWGLTREGVCRTVPGHQGAIRALAFAPEGTLASGGEDGMVKLWDTAQAKEKFTLTEHGGPVCVLAFSPGGKTLVSGGADGTLLVWDPATGTRRQILEGHRAAVTTVTFHPQDGALLSGGRDRRVLRWPASPVDLPPGTLQANPLETWFAAFSPAGDCLATGGSGGRVSLWRRQPEPYPFKYPERTWRNQDHLASCGVFLEKGKILATGSMEGSIRLWDAHSAQALGTLQGHAGRIRALIALPGGKDLISASEDATVKLWEVTATKEKATLQGNTMVMYALAVSPDGKTLASVGGDHRRPGPGEVLLWDLPTRKVRKVFPGVESAWGVAFSPDGQYLAVAFARGSVEIWNLTTGQVSTVFDVPYVRPLAFSPDGKLLAAGYGKHPSQNRPGEGGVRVWDTKTWTDLATFPDHEHVVFTVAFSPDGKTLVSASQDGKVKQWSTALIPTSKVAASEPKATAPSELTTSSFARRLAFDFHKKLDDLPALSVFGPDADQVMKTDAAGLRITLPAGRADCNNVGLELPLRLRGDFEVELGYEILAIGAPIANPGAGVHLRLQLENSSPVVALTRLATPFSPRRAPLYGVVGHDGEIFGAFRISNLPNGNETGFHLGKRVRAEAPKGRLRLKRTGSQLKYLVSDGESPWHLVKAEEIGDVDVASLRAFGFSGWGPVAVDVRFTDLVVSADEFPDGIPGALDRSHALLPALLLGCLTLTVAAGVLLWVRQRRRARPALAAKE
jgi:RNA polymerase sigma factor (sigma-70 family)